MSIQLPNDDHTDVEIVKPSAYGYAQPWYEAKRRKRKNPLGFVWPEKAKSKSRKKS